MYKTYDHLAMMMIYLLNSSILVRYLVFGIQILVTVGILAATLVIWRVWRNSSKKSAAKAISSQDSILTTDDVVKIARQTSIEVSKVTGEGKES